MATYLILFGANIEPNKNLAAALDKLRGQPKLSVEAISNVYESPMVLASGDVDLSRPPFLNAAITVRADLDSEAMRGTLRRLEAEMGRVRVDDKFADRTVDLDILAVRTSDGTLEFGTELKQHAHAALPSAEIVPDWIVSSTGLTVAEIADGFKMKETLIRRKR
jgi:2-amino-4-hydroxy-6-hydroxymethyldihydropteridine diphosphokinase